MGPGIALAWFRDSKLRLPVLIVAVLFLAVSAAFGLAGFSSVMPATFGTAAAEPSSPVTTSAMATAVTGTTFYVSKTGNNRNGLSWATAWNELDQIDWERVQPGDRIILDGGSSEMVYTSVLAPQRDGTADAPIRIQVATEAGRNGKVVIFGGRSTPLPYCGQNPYEFQSEGVRSSAIVLDDRAWIIVDGMRWRGITAYGHNGSAIDLSSESSNLLVRNIELYDNGRAIFGGRKDLDGWAPSGRAVDLAGTNIAFERAIIHDNGHDAFQSTGQISNFTLRESWLYNARTNPLNGDVFNRCEHQDGIQIYDGGVHSGILVEQSVIGPGLLQGLLLGQELVRGNVWAVVNDVVIRDSLFYGSSVSNISVHRTEPRNWTIERITSYREPEQEWHNMRIPGTGHRVSNSILVGGREIITSDGTRFSNNCQWNMDNWRDVGDTADPQFVAVADGNYALRASSPCAGRGSSITSAAQLLSRGETRLPPAPMVPTAEAQPADPAPPATATPVPAAPQRATSVPKATTVPALSLNSCGALVQQGEGGERRGAFVVGNDDAADGGRFVHVPDGRGSFWDVDDNESSVRFCVTVTTPGSYKLAAHVYAADGDANSFFVVVNDAATRWNFAINDDYERDYVDGEDGDIIYELPAGDHEVIFYLREDGARLDRFELERVAP